MDAPKFDFLNLSEPSQIPIPDVSYLKTKVVKKESAPLIKYEREYEAFCRWSALPKEEREPKTDVAFERKWGLPKTTLATNFKERSDFAEKRLNYFWEWMMEKLPDVVYGQYKKAVDKGDTNAAKFFGELVAKHMNIDKPKATIQPFMLVGVPQEKINRLFEPRSFQEAELVPEKKK